MNFPRFSLQPQLTKLSSLTRNIDLGRRRPQNDTQEANPFLTPVGPPKTWQVESVTTHHAGLAVWPKEE